MKIAVIYYHERGDYSKEEQVIETLKKYYSNSENICKKEWGNKLTFLLRRVGIEETDIRYITTRDSYDRMMVQENVRNIAPDFVVSFNLAGFENVTLTDNYSYNLLNIPQIHFCTKAEAEKISKVLAINMFMVQI